MRISKKARNLIAYLIGGTVVIAGTILLVTMANGWQYNFLTGEITETGLILMGSEPSGATITLNGKALSQKTNYRYPSAPVGDYDIRYEKAQFRPWTNRTTVSPGEVTFLDYAWLIPNEIPTRDRYENLQITQAYQTKDRKRFVLVDSTKPTAPDLLTTTDTKRPPQTLLTNSQISSVLGRPLTAIGSLQFSDDSSHILFQATASDGSVAWLTASASPSTQPTITNINQTLVINPSWIAWVPRGNNEITYIETNTLRRAQIREKKISEALAQNVISARWTKDWLVFITSQANSDAPNTITQKLFIRPADSSTNTEVTTLTDTGQHFDTRYIRSLDRDYIAVLNTDSKILTLVTGIFHNSEKRAQSQIGKNITAITLSPNNRFLTHNANNQMVTIDFERFKRYRAGTSLEGLTEWSWMNDQHLAVKLNNDLKLIDFDSQNSQLIAGSLTPTSPILFFENKTLLTLMSDEDKATLRQHYLDPEKFSE